MLGRNQRIQHYKRNPDISVLVIGAGINGIGVFWDLALQGVDVLLIDRSDYSSGASAASSHMAHGGIRYLENGEFRLVREAVQERNRLIENAPHLVKPLPTTFPIFKLFSGILNAPLKFLGMLDRPSERGALVIKIGMTLYDFFTHKQGTVPKHRFLNRERSLEKFSELNPTILYTGTYYDGAIRSPERIAIELLTDAASYNKHAIPLNYVSAEKVNEDVIVLCDEISGESFTVKPNVVVNAAGPWIDRVNHKLNRNTSYIGGTKGSHLVLDHPELSRSIKGHEFFFENNDGRIVLIFPLEERVLIGTTDIRIDDPDAAIITEEEVRYFIEMIRRVFPAIKVEERHIVFTFSGVRPLENSGTNFTGQISRDHKIEIDEIGGIDSIPVLSLVGGKWTTFRALAEQTSDRILGMLGRARNNSTECVKIGGGKDYPIAEKDRSLWISKVSRNMGLDEKRVETLLKRYGTRAEEIADFISSDIDMALTNYPSYSRSEIAYIVQHEDVVHLDDFLLRRSMIGMLGLCSREGLEEVGQVIGGVLDWSESKIQNEIQRTIHILRVNHKMGFDGYCPD
jgi:glycerol-3-phosphate dehydrogenase